MKVKAFTIRIKFILVALLISLVSFGVAAYISNRWVMEDLQKRFEEKAFLIGRDVIHDLQEGMRSSLYHEDITRSIDIDRNYEEVEELRVFNTKGKEVFGDEQTPPDARVKEALRTGRMIHFQKQIHQQNVAAFVIPVENKPECQGCHGKDEALRGALLLSLSLEKSEQSVWKQRKRFFVLFGLIAMVICAITFLAVDRLLVKRLEPIQIGAEAIEKGNFGYQIPIESDDEIGNLTRYINRMAEKLQTFFKELEEKNRQLTLQFTLVSRSQKEWQETFDCITDPIAVVDQNDSLIRANRALKETFQEYFPQTGDEAIDQTWSRYFLREFLPHRMDSVRLEDQGPTTQEFHHLGTGRVFEVSLFPHYFLEGSFSGYVVLWKDIMEKKEAEMGLIMNERLAALGQMASGIAHELNNPLATIAACNESLLNRVEKENIGSLLFRSYLKMIEEEIQRCKTITTGMLSFVRKDGREKREIDINEVLDKTMDMVTFQGRLKDVEVLRNSQRRIPKVLGNDGELMQVFLSIVVNALDAMEDKGTLAFETGSEGNTVFVKISDSGPGIPAYLIKKIFDPFFTTKSAKGGTGLGLAMANKIAKDYKGKIDVSSEEGKGTTFKIVLPCETIG